MNKISKNGRLDLLTSRLTAIRLVKNASSTKSRSAAIPVNGFAAFNTGYMSTSEQRSTTQLSGDTNTDASRMK
jgi:hypothetical protein